MTPEEAQEALTWQTPIRIAHRGVVSVGSLRSVFKSQRGKNFCVVEIENPESRKPLFMIRAIKAINIA